MSKGLTAVFNGKDSTKYHKVFHVREKEDGLLFSDAFEIHVLELPKLRKQPLKLNALECWLLYLDNMEGEIMEQIVIQEPMIQRAMTIEEAFMKSESDRYLYELREKGRNDYNNAISTAEKRGEARGKLEIARAMLADNMSFELIAKLTGLSKEELKDL